MAKHYGNVRGDIYPNKPIYGSPIIDVSSNETIEEKEVIYCDWCGKPIPDRKKRFCSDKCRVSYHNRNRKKKRR